jgi:hypothetical protein
MSCIDITLLLPVHAHVACTEVRCATASYNFMEGILNSRVGAKIVYELSVMSASSWSAAYISLILKLVTGRSVRITTSDLNPWFSRNMVNSVYFVEVL